MVLARSRQITAGADARRGCLNIGETRQPTACLTDLRHRSSAGCPCLMINETGQAPTVEGSPPPEGADPWTRQRRGFGAGLDVLVPAHRVVLALPDIATLRQRSQALATLDAIMSPDWESRYFSFDSRCGPQEEMAAMRNGPGDAYSIVFSYAGVFIRGFDHESVMSPYRSGRVWPGLIDSVPDVFASSLNEPAFSHKDGVLEATVCLWRQHGADRWHTGDLELPDGDDPDGADWMFETLLDGTGVSYQRFAEDYYETAVSIDAVVAIFALGPLTDELVQHLNPDVSVADLADDLAEIGYPPAHE